MLILIVSTLIISARLKTMTPNIKFDYTPPLLQKACDDLIATTQKKTTLLTQSKTALFDFESLLSEYYNTALPLEFLSYVSSDKALQEAAFLCTQKLSQFNVELMTRRDIYEAIQKTPVKNAQQKRLLSEMKTAFENNGLKLPDIKMNQFRQYKQELTQLENAFQNHLNKDNTIIQALQSELNGVPEEYLKTCTKVGDKYNIPTKQPDYDQIMRYAHNADVRKRMQEAFENRGAQNNKTLLSQSLLLRSKIAELLGYSSWADYRTHDRMAKSSLAVESFLNNVQQKIFKVLMKNLKQMKDFKKEITQKEDPLTPWDISYLTTRYKKEKLNFDLQIVQEYFPTEQVIQGIFDIYSKMLQVSFHLVQTEHVWAKNVQLYEVKEGKKTVGYFYADFYPREGKYGHAAAFSLRLGYQKGKEYIQPVSAIVANFTPATSDKPSLLKHSEVETLFHEFGHIMHQVLTKAPYASLSGTNVDHDFVEAPSQMLENWAYDPIILQKISGHYKDHSKKLPAEMIQKIISQRHFNQGIFYMRQLIISFFDLKCHQQKDLKDPVELYKKLYKDLMTIDPLATTNFPATFGHIMGGYDAGYYSYLWSKVYAQDMFSVFQPQGLQNSVIGLQYRKKVLEQGKMKDASDLLKDFLGREPNFNAFYQYLESE